MTHTQVEHFISKGMDLDTHESLLSQGSLVYMLNGDISGLESQGNDTFVQNVLSNDLCHKFPTNYELKGAVGIGKEQFALFFETGASREIGLFDASTCAYMVKVNDPCLRFTGAVKGVYKNKPGCDLRRVYYISEAGPVQFLDIDECAPVKNVADCQDCDTQYEFDCEAYSLNRCVKVPNVKLIPGVGNLPNGNYQVAIAPTADGERLTSYYIFPQVLRFHSNNQGVNRFGIEVTFDGCPQGYDEFEVVLISHRTDRATLAQRIGVYSANQTSITIAELDSTFYAPIDLAHLLEVFPRYQSAAHIAANNEQLILGGVTYRETPNYQPRANRIRSRWTVKQVKGKYAHQHKSYQRGETYAHFIRGVYCDNERTPWYHIPSDAEQSIMERPTGAADWALYNTTVVNGDVCASDNPCGDDPKKYWELYDTSKSECRLITEHPCFEVEATGVAPFTVDYTNCKGKPFTITSNTASVKFCTPFPGTVVVSGGGTTALTGNQCGIYQEITELCTSPADECDGVIIDGGTFGYWESTLQYPNNPCVWGQRDDATDEFYDPYGLSCQKVRYHKFPDHCTTPINADADCGDEDYVNILGIEFSNIQPFVDRDGNPVKDIVAYEIGVADRSNHKSILHCGLMYNMWEEELSDCTTSYYPNYPFNDLRPDPFLSETFAHHTPLPPSTPAPIDVVPFLELDYTPVTRYSRRRFEYISPDVSYERNDVGTWFQVKAEMNGDVSGEYRYTDEMPEQVILSDLAYLTANIVGISLALTLQQSIWSVIDGTNTILNSMYETLRPLQYATNYFARTRYRRTRCERVVPGNIWRRIEAGQYTLPTKMLIGEDKVNNWQRESGLYLRLCDDIQDPYTVDKSRITLRQNFCRPSFEECEGTAVGVPETSSYYGAVRVDRPDQYGMPDNNLVMSASGYVMWDNTATVQTPRLFSGDVFITQHRHIRKMPFFTGLPLDTPPRTPYELSSYFNVWNTRRWLDTNQLVTGLAGLLSWGAVSLAYRANDDRNLEETGKLKRNGCSDGDGDCSTDYLFRVDGTFYTHVVGEIVYWCESEYIGNFREKNEIPESDIDRPNEQKAAYRTVQYPELFLYNQQYRWQGFHAYGTHFDRNYDCCKPDLLCATNTLAYSVKHDPLSRADAWLKFLPQSIQQFSGRDGDLVGMREIDDFNLLLFFEDGTYVTQQDESILTENGRLFIGTPDAFSRRMRKVSDDASGFGGCIDMESVIPTRYGTYWIDRKRKKLVMYDGQVHDVTGKMQAWLQENLEGPVTGVFDNFTDNLYYTGVGRGGKQWTLSFKPRLALGSQERNGWVSFHSFLPDSYLPMANNFLSVGSGGVWKHNKKREYQTYYGKTYPFEIGCIIKKEPTQAQLESVTVYSEWFKHTTDGCKVYDPYAFFDKVALSDRLRTTGLLPVLVKDNRTVRQTGAQNRNDLVEVTAQEDFTYNINYTTVGSMEQPVHCLDVQDMEIQPLSAVNTTDKGIRPHLRGKWYRAHFVKEAGKDEKVLMQVAMTNNDNIVQ